MVYFSAFPIDKVNKIERRCRKILVKAYRIIQNFTFLKEKIISCMIIRMVSQRCLPVVYIHE